MKSALECFHQPARYAPLAATSTGRDWAVVWRTLAIRLMDVKPDRRTRQSHLWPA